VYVREGERVNGLVPSIDVTLLDAAAAWGSSVTAVVLTGIGRDGREGARAINAAGGRVLVEHESTAAVYGMPRAIVEAGLADAEVPLHEIADELVAGVVDA
jgi:two-component system chemotaxis response regulator CheB